jgi:hypothetical protein
MLPVRSFVLLALLNWLKAVGMRAKGAAVGNA